ncbi:MAG: hypothetical protein AYK19_00515 [Theionarchaea archaeon DG-70-1]|nr:MAG: hypothetical protein AYK19_00515 [Theionarchaea archaeon DG-70-1]
MDRNFYIEEFPKSIMAIKNSCWGIVLLLFCGLLHQGQLSCTLNPGGGQVVHFDINPETVIIDNLIGEESLKEIIFGTKDKKLAVLNFISLGVHFLIPTEGNVTHIGVADINNDGQNELIFTTEDNFLCTYDCNGCVLYKKNLEDESPNDILDFTFLDVNKDGATDIIVGTSSGIKAIDGTSVCIDTADTTEQSIWSLTDRSLSGIWPLPEESSLHLTTADIDRFEESEIIGYTENTVFTLNYSGGILWKKDFSKITALSIYNDPVFYPKKCIMVALADGTLFKIDYNGNWIPWSNEEVSKDIGMTASKIVPSKSDAASDKHTFFFIISDEKEAKAFTFSGDEINFEFNSDILDIECANLDNEKAPEYSPEEYQAFVLPDGKPDDEDIPECLKENHEQCPKKDFEEIVVSTSNGDFRVFIYCRNELREFPLDSQNEGETPENVVFSKLAEKNKEFVLFHVLKEEETWLIRKDRIFGDIEMFFSFYKQATEKFPTQHNGNGEGEDYKEAAILYNILLYGFYLKLAKYYGLNVEIYEKIEICGLGMIDARKELLEGINDKYKDGLEKENMKEFFGAIIDFYEAYKEFNTLEISNEIIRDYFHEEPEWPGLTREDLKDKMYPLLFFVLDETDREYNDEAYEEAHKGFLEIYPVYSDFSPGMTPYIEENESFRKYEGLLDDYPDCESIVKAMDSCVEELKKKAEEHFKSREFKEARSTYEAIKRMLEDREGKEIPFTVEYTEKEINEEIDKCDEEIRKNYIIYLCVGLVIAFLSLLVFRYRKEINRKFFQKERWTTEELYDRLDESEKLLNTGYPEPAANLAGKVLEKALKMYIRKNPQLYHQWNPDKSPRKDKRASLGQLIPWLSKYDPAVDEIQRSKLNTWRMIRNRSSHDSEEELHNHDIDDMIEGIRDFVARYLEPKYQGG